MDSYYAPLKDTHRYWVGLLLLVRNISYLTSEFLNANRTPKYSLHIIFSLMVGLLLLKFIYMGFPSAALNKLFKQSRVKPVFEESFAIKDREDSSKQIGTTSETTRGHQKNSENGIVYKSPYLDLLETYFLVNLAVFTYFTLYFEDEDQGQDVFFYISSSIVLPTFVGIPHLHLHQPSNTP